MFVRTKKGKILKCFKNESMNLPIYYVIGSKTNSYVEYQDVKKVSENIIDIIEVGDYVNGLRVRATYLDGINHYIKIGEPTKEGIRTYNGDIKSIVTKEQFESMSYKVGE